MMYRESFFSRVAIRSLPAIHGPDHLEFRAILPGVAPGRTTL